MWFDFVKAKHSLLRLGLKSVSLEQTAEMNCTLGFSISAATQRIQTGPLLQRVTKAKCNQLELKTRH